MSFYQFLANKLRKFSIIDFTCIKWAYLLLGLLFVHLDKTLLTIGFIPYAVLFILTSIPLWLAMFSVQGSIVEKACSFLKNNNPERQVLTLVCCLSFAMCLAVFFPMLASFCWTTYLGLIIVLAIRPIYVAWFRK